MCSTKLYHPPQTQHGAGVYPRSASVKLERDAGGQLYRQLATLAKLQLPMPRGWGATRPTDQQGHVERAQRPRAMVTTQ